jgi:hypothetical protein
MNWTPEHLAVPQPRLPRRGLRTGLVGSAGALTGATTIGLVAWLMLAAATEPTQPRIQDSWTFDSSSVPQRADRSTPV